MDFELVKKIACRLQAISNFAYDIHYNARGKDFYENHLFAERIGDKKEVSELVDELFEIVFLGRGKDVPNSKELSEIILSITPSPKKDEEANYKKLRSMIISCLDDIQSLELLTRGEKDVFGRIAFLLQLNNGLLFACLRYDEDEKIEDETEEKWTIENDRWITLHPNKENPDDYRRLKVEEGETLEEAVERKFGKNKDKEEKEPADKKTEEKKEFVPFSRATKKPDRKGGNVEYREGFYSFLATSPDLDELDEIEKGEHYERVLSKIEEMDEVKASGEKHDSLQEAYLLDMKELFENELKIQSSEEYFKRRLKEAEEFSKKKEIKGIKKGKEMNFREADSGSVNPKYVKRDIQKEKEMTEQQRKELNQYRVNCQTCVLAFEARTRGYNVEAKGNTKEDGDMCRRLSVDTRRAYVDPNTGKMPKNLGKWEEINTDKRLIKFLDKTVKKGERYNLSVNWKYGSAHVISVIRDENDNLVLYDPQNDKKYSKETALSEFLGREGKSVVQYKVKTYWREERTPPEIYRVDNMLLNPVYAETVLRRK